jgi:hypothetical protein
MTITFYPLRLKAIVENLTARDYLQTDIEGVNVRDTGFFYLETTLTH